MLKRMALQRTARQVSGLMAKRKGESFERFVVNAARAEKLFVIRIPDGCVQRKGKGGRPLLIRVQTPFDFVLIKTGLSVFLDSKTTAGKTFPHSLIKHHQLENLLEASKAGPAGYLVYFEALDQIVFYSAIKLYGLKKGESLKPEDGILLGGRYTMKFAGMFEHWLNPEGPRQDLNSSFGDDFRSNQ